MTFRHPAATQFNEPMSICQLGYGIGVFAPGVEAGTTGQYKCGHHLLLAHGRTVQLYRGKYQKQQQVKAVGQLIGD
jgi:beta-glucosidase/6-phospho-beta-glucosidase/beta-galactosidase